MKTIIDNNIYYALNRGEIDTKDLDIINPTVTNSNIDEFARSHNVLYSIDNVRGSLREAMEFCGKSLIGENPYMHVFGLDGQKMDLTKHDRDIMDITEKIARGYEVTEQNRQYVSDNWILPRDKELSDISNVYNEWFENIRNNPKFNLKTLKDDELMEIIKTTFRENIDSWAKAHLDGDVRLSEDFDWNQIELFLNTFAAFFKQNLAGGKFKPHDAYDLHQLLYVQPGDKYWTKDKKWQNLIYEQAKMGSYLIEFKNSYLKP